MPTSFRIPLARLAALVLVARAAASAAEPMVRGGGARALYLDADGTVWSWASGTFGELGAGSIVTARSTPGLSPASHIQPIAAGRGFSLALKSDGTVAPRFIQIGVLVTDTTNTTTGCQPQTIRVVPAGGGGG